MRYAKGVALALLVSFALTTAASAKAPGLERVPVCHVKPNGKYRTQYVPPATKDKLVASSSGPRADSWLDGPCDKFFSPD